MKEKEKKIPRRRGKSVSSMLENKKTGLSRLADIFTNSFGTVSFLFFNIFFFLVWISLNSGAVPSIPVFDPYPYGLLTTAVSLEAIFLSIIVLISQNRASKIDTLREKIDLEINIRAEKEITRILNMLDEVHDHLGINPTEDDNELKEMKKHTRVEEIRDEIVQRELEK